MGWGELNWQEHKFLNGIEVEQLTKQESMHMKQPTLGALHGVYFHVLSCPCPFQCFLKGIVNSLRDGGKSLYWYGKHGQLLLHGNDFLHRDNPHGEKGPFLAASTWKPFTQSKVNMKVALNVTTELYIRYKGVKDLQGIGHKSRLLFLRQT